MHVLEEPRKQLGSRWLPNSILVAAVHQTERPGYSGALFDQDTACPWIRETIEVYEGLFAFPRAWLEREFVQHVIAQLPSRTSPGLSYPNKHW